MAITVRQQIPSPKNYRETFELSLEGQQFTINYTYNPRSDGWYFSLIKDGSYALDNVKLTQGYRLGFNYIDFPLTQGYLTLYSPENNTNDANLHNFGASVYLVYEVDDDS